MEILSADGAGIRRAADIIRGGGLVAWPTETVYGLGANALDAAAVARIFEAKGRPRFDPLITHLPDTAAVEALAGSLDPVAESLAARFWPGPLTLLVPRPDQVPALVTSGLDTLAVRVPDHPAGLALLREAGVPVAAPSANPFGRISPTRASHVVAGLGDLVDAVLDGGPTRWGVESTIVDTRGGRAEVLRLGAVTVEQLGEVVAAVTVRAGDPARPATPGALPSHYAPRTPLRLAGAADPPPPDADRCAHLSVVGPARPGYRVARSLAPDGDLVTAAARLFDTLHELDAAGVDLILAVAAPDEGLGRAINDRLRRAAAGHR